MLLMLNNLSCTYWLSLDSIALRLREFKVMQLTRVQLYSYTYILILLYNITFIAIDTYLYIFMYILRFAQLSVYVKERSEFLIYGGSDISGLFSNVLLLCTVNSEGTIHTHACHVYYICIIPTVLCNIPTVLCKHIRRYV